MSDCLRLHGLEDSRLPCPSLFPRACSNSYPLNWWCHTTISSSVVPFFCCLQSFPAWGFFPMSRLFTSDGQSIGVSASASVLPVNTQGSFPLGFNDLISLLSRRLSRVFSNIPVWINSPVLSLLYSPTLSSVHDYWKNHSFDKVVSLLFNTLSRFVIAFLLRSKHLFISWLQSPCAVILEPEERNSVTVSIVSPSVCHEVVGLNAMILVFWMLSLKPAFSLSCFTFIKRILSSSLLSALGWCHLHFLGYWYFSQQSWFQLVIYPTKHLVWSTLHISLKSRVTIYSLDVLLWQFGTSLSFHTQF